MRTVDRGHWTLASRASSRIIAVKLSECVVLEEKMESEAQRVLLVRSQECQLSAATRKAKLHHQAHHRIT